MARCLLCCVLLPVAVLAELCSDAGIISKSVCVGDSVQVFQNITSASIRIGIALYKSAYGKQETIGVWVMNNSSVKSAISDEYKSKILFENETITLDKFQSSDEATYVIIYDITGSQVRRDVQLCAIIPPTHYCKPKIKHEGEFLIALLDNPEYCGKPVVSVHWMEYPGILYKSKAVIELPPGKEAGTYYACTEGEALACAPKSTEQDNCEYVTIGSTSGNESPTLSSDILQMKTTIVMIAIIVSVVLLIVIANLIILWRKFRIMVRLGGPMRDRPFLTEHSCDVGDSRYTDPEGEPLGQQDSTEMTLLGSR